MVRLERLATDKATGKPVTAPSVGMEWCGWNDWRPIKPPENVGLAGPWFGNRETAYAQVMEEAGGEKSAALDLGLREAEDWNKEEKTTKPHERLVPVS